MKLKYASEYTEFTMFLSELEVGADAIVFDKDAECSLLCKVVGISEDGRVNATYDAEFITPYGNFMVGVECIRPETYPNEFFPLMKNFDGIYC